MGGGTVGDEREVDDNVRMTGIEPLQFADWIISAGTTEEAIVGRERTGDGRQSPIVCLRHGSVSILKKIVSSLKGLELVIRALLRERTTYGMIALTFRAIALYHVITLDGKPCNERTLTLVLQSTVLGNDT